MTDHLLHIKADNVKLKVPKLRLQTLETAIIERYQRRESSGAEALIEMYLGLRCIWRVFRFVVLRISLRPHITEAPYH